MVEHKVEPVEETVEDAPKPTHTQTHEPDQNRDGQAASPSGPEVRRHCGAVPSAQAPECTSSVRNKVLERVVAQQQQRISQLERQVDKRKETFWRLSNSPPFIPPPGLGILPHVPSTTAPPGASAPASPAMQSSQPQPEPVTTASDTTNATQHQQHQSQPLTQNPAMAATMAAMTAASTRSVPGALHTPYPFFPYPHPDNPVIAPSFMGVISTVPPHPMPPRMQPPSSTSPSRVNQASEDGSNRQSRYWTPDEHQRYLAAVNTFGPKNYQQIAEVVGTRNAKQVRTHSQKFQKKLEREEARRRGDSRILSDVPASGHTQLATPAVISDGTPGLTPIRFHQNDVHRGGPATASSKNLNPNDTPTSAKSVDGSSSTNNAPSERKGETNIDHAQAKAAAAAAVAAEAVALGFGRLPPRANAMTKMLEVSNPTNSGSQVQKRWPAETKCAKANGNQVAPTHLDGNVTDPGKATHTRSYATTHPVILPCPRTNASTPRLEVKTATTMPGGRGAESHQLTEKKLSQKLHDSAEVITPSRRPDHSSGHVSSVRSRLGPDKRQVAKLMPSAVKIEPRIVPSVPNSGQLRGSCPTATTIPHSHLTALPATTSSNPAIKTANDKSNKETSAPTHHKPAEGVRNTCLRTEVDSNGPVRTKDATSPAHRKNEVIPNGQHGIRNICQRDRLEVVGVSNKPSANKSSLPASSKKVAHNVSTPSKKSDKTRHARDPSETSGNGERPNESQRVAPMHQETAELRKKKPHAENHASVHSDREDPQTSDRTNGIAAKKSFAAQKSIKSDDLSGASEFASTDRVVPKDEKVSLLRKDDIDKMDRETKQRSTFKKPAGQVTSREVAGWHDSSKTGIVMRCDGQPNPAPIEKSETIPNHEELTTKKRSHADHVHGGTERSAKCDPKKAVKEAQVKRQCCNPDSVPDEAPDREKGIKMSMSSSVDASKEYGGLNEDQKEAGGQFSCGILNGQAAPSVGALRAARHRDAGSRYEGEELAKQETKHTMSTDKTDVTTKKGRRTERDDSEEETEKANVKRPLELGAESVAKRQKGSDDGNRILREDKEN